MRLSYTKEGGEGVVPQPSERIHFYCPLVQAHEVRWQDCPTCEARVPMVGKHYEWHGWSITCLGCGENWGDGEMLERPFERAWRRKSIADALSDIRGAVVILPGDDRH